MSDVLVLCYHAVSDRWASDLAVSRACLERQVGQLVARGYRGATFTQAIVRPSHAKSLVVTFDDAFASTLLAAPILARLGVPGTVFVPTAFVDKPGPMRWPGIEHWADGGHGNELTCMTWDQLADLAREGWEVGSHTASHPELPSLPDRELAEELTESRAAIEDRLGRPCESIAYPYGLYDERVSAAAEAAGYVTGGTLTRLPHRAEPLAWPRVGAYETRPWLFRVKTSPVLRRVAALKP